METRYSSQSPQKYLYVLSTKPPSRATFSSIACLPLAPSFSDEKLGSPPPLLPTQISKLPTDVVSGIRAITVPREQAGCGTCTLPQPLALALALRITVACDTVRLGYLCPRCEVQTVYVYVRCCTPAS